MSKKLKEIPKFANEAEEREFWMSHDTTDYFDWSKAKRVTFPNLKLTTQSISLRLPLWMLDSIKTTANMQDVPYQSLIKVWLNEKLEEAHHRAK
jgi:predicted DNA binding CopG/RHH family protein